MATKKSQFVKIANTDNTYTLVRSKDIVSLHVSEPVDGKCNIEIALSRGPNSHLIGYAVSDITKSLKIIEQSVNYTATTDSAKLAGRKKSKFIAVPHCDGRTSYVLSDHIVRVNLAGSSVDSEPEYFTVSYVLDDGRTVNAVTESDSDDIWEELNSCL